MYNQQRLKKVALMLMMSMLCLISFAQERQVQGIVKDKSGEPMIGVNVLVKGTTNGTITGVDGDFTLSGVKKSDILSFTYIGFKNKELKYEGEKLLNVVLEEDSELLDEVVVIGYGTVNKRDLTGSVASVSSQDIASIPVSSASEALTGKMAGVNITTTEGSPDADIKIRIRGGGSLSQDNSPLYIVDGFPVSSISDIAPSEIQSIDVLKDASSTAIYGARGANGVIIVTTKSGKEGKVQVDFGASFGFKKVTKMTEVMSPYDFVAYQREIGSLDYGNYNDMDIWKSIDGIDYQDEIFGRTGNQQQYNVNVAGGSKQLTYSVSYAHNEEKSIMLGSGFKKDNINAKLKSELNKWLTLDFNARLSYSTIEGLSGGADTNESNAANSTVANAVVFRPVNALSHSSDDDEESNAALQKTPLERLLATNKGRNSFRQNYNFGLNWKPFKNWTFRSEFGYGWRYEDTEQYWGTDAVSNSKYGYNGRPQAYLLRETTKNWRNANTLTYENKKMFDGRDRLNVLVGHEVSSSMEESIENVSVNFPTTMGFEDMKANMGAGTALPNQSTISAEENMLSFFGRVNYTMRDKYLLTVTVRADGSSKFGDGNRWGVFPSAALAWRISDEAFMANTKDWLSALKLRLSFGTAGNNRINSGLLYTTYSLSGNDSRNPFFNGTSTPMLEHGTYLYNPKLKWETTVTRNLGIDYGFWNNRISGSVDVYWNTTRDLLMKAEIPGNSGYSYQYQNFGQTSNKGIEMSMDAVLVDTKNFSLNFTANVAYNRNRIDKLTTDSPWQSSNWAGSTISKYEDFRVEEGGRLGEVWGFRTNGYYTVYDPVTNPTGELVWGDKQWVLKDGMKDNSPTITGGSYYPGGLKIQTDENGNPLKQRLGNTVAPWVGGFGLNGRFGNSRTGELDVNIFFNYSTGNVIINGTKLASSFRSGSRTGYNLNNDFRLGNRYTWIDPETGLNLASSSTAVLNHYGDMQAAGLRLNEINSNANMYNPAAASTMQLIDYAVEDASFLRLNNLTIGYSLPKHLVKKAFLQNVRVYLTGYNLFCWTSYSGADPEVDVSSKRNAMTPGVDYAAYPKSRTFVGGINITF